MKKILLPILMLSFLSTTIAQTQPASNNEVTEFSIIDATTIEKSIYSNQDVSKELKDMRTLERKGKLTEAEKLKLAAYYIRYIKQNKIDHKEKKVSPKNIEKLVSKHALKGNIQAISYLFYIYSLNEQYSEALKWIYFSLDYPGVKKNYESILKTESFLKSKLSYEDLKVVNQEVVALFKKVGVYNRVHKSSKTKSNERLFSKIANHQTIVNQTHSKDDILQLFNLYLDGIITQFIPSNDQEVSLQNFEKNILPFAIANDKKASTLLSTAGVVYNNNEYTLLWSLVANSHSDNTVSESDFLQSRIDKVIPSLSDEQIQSITKEANTIIRKIKK